MAKYRAVINGVTVNADAIASIHDLETAQFSSLIKFNGRVVVIDRPPVDSEKTAESMAAVFLEFLGFKKVEGGT